MAKVIKEFTVEEYYQDFKFITNSQIKDFEYCPFLYIEKRHGKVPRFEKPYFTYGKAVDCILSGEKFDDFFYVGEGKEKTVIQLEEEIAELQNEMAERVKPPTKTQLNKMEKLEMQLEKAKETEGKIRLTPTEYTDVQETAEEIKSQPLYRAFDNCKPQTIIATTIDVPGFKNVKVKGMIDKLDLENKILEDDKTSGALSSFDTASLKQQLAWYRMLVRVVFDVICDCYAAAGDKGATYTKIKRSSLYYAPSGLLDYQEQLNEEALIKLLTAQKENNYPTCIDIDGEEMREQKCFGCDHYKTCPHSRQRNFITLV